METQPKVCLLSSRTFLQASKLTSPLQIDMVKLARLTGYTLKSAPVVFGNIKRKIKTLGEELAAEGPATPKNGSATKKPKSSGKRAAGKSAGGDNDESPTKKVKAAAAKKKGAAKATEEDDDEEDFDLMKHRVKKEEAEGLDGFESFMGQDNAEYDFAGTQDA